jgi:hypothetical protein
LKLLHKAAGVAEANSKHALEMAQKLSRQLQEAENRIIELEAEHQLYREKAEHAERWLHKISTEIEERLIRLRVNKVSMLLRLPNDDERCPKLRLSPFWL